MKQFLKVGDLQIFEGSLKKERERNREKRTGREASKIWQKL